MSGPSSIDKMTEHKLKMLEADSDGAYLCVTCNYSNCKWSSIGSRIIICIVGDEIDMLLDVYFGN